MPTRYALDVELKSIVTGDVVSGANPTTRQNARKDVKKIFEEKYAAAAIPTRDRKAASRSRQYGGRSAGTVAAAACVCGARRAAAPAAHAARRPACGDEHREAGSHRSCSAGRTLLLTLRRFAPDAVRCSGSSVLAQAEARGADHLQRRQPPCFSAARPLDECSSMILRFRCGTHERCLPRSQVQQLHEDGQEQVVLPEAAVLDALYACY